MKKRPVVALCMLGAFLVIGPPAIKGILIPEFNYGALELASVWVNAFARVPLALAFSAPTNAYRANSAAQTQPATATIPFAGTLSFRPSQSFTIFVKPVNSTYLSLQFASAAPYPLLSPSSVVTHWLSAGLKNVLALPPGPTGVGRQSQVCAISTLDNDGSQVVACGGASSITVSRYSSTLPAASVTYPVGPDVNSVFSADLNGDGNPDLVVAFDGNGTPVPGGIAILINKGDGSFNNPVVYGDGAPATQFSSGGTPATRFAVFDLNHDGALDIATASLGGIVTVLLGKGNGAFGPPVQYTVGGSGEAITIADVNGDGIPDIVAGGTTGILLGNGDGSFRAGPPLPAVASGTLIWAFAAGDLNGDGKIDLVYADIENQVGVPLFGKGDGTFTPGQAYAVSLRPDSLVLADYNSDGRLDIINGLGDARIFGPAGESGNTDILLNNGDGTFRGTPTYFTLPNSEASGFGSGIIASMAAARFAGTSPGILASAASALTLFRGDGKGGLQVPQSIAFQGQPGAIAAADFNGDGLPDAAVVTGSNVTILPGAVGGFSSPLPTVPSGGVFPTALATGDFDGDGKADLAVVSSVDAYGAATSPGTLSFLKSNGNGTFQTPVTITAGLSPLSLSAIDLNLDGKLDLIFSDSGTNGKGGGVYVALNKGAGAFQNPVKVFSGNFPAFGLADVNGDGKLDLVASSGVVATGQSVVSWFSGNGDGTFQAPIAISTSDAPVNAILVQDFNGDGNPDIVLAHQAEDTTFLAGYGAGAFSAETHFITTGEPTFLQTADFNGDGKPDLIVAGNTISVLLNKSVPSLQATVVSAAPAISTAIAPGSLASAYGTDLASHTAGGAPLPLPTTFGDTSISIQDASGNVSAAPLLYVIPTQVNFEVPPDLATGAATVTVTSGDGTQSVANVQVEPVAPGLFELNSAGLTAAYVTVYHADGSQTVEKVYTANSAGAVVAHPVSLGSATDKAYLIIFGTGLQAAGTAAVKATVGGISLPVQYAGPQGSFVGLDQVNVRLPASLAGKGNVTIHVTASGIAANDVNVTIQ